MTQSVPISTPLIAPLWADYDFRVVGRVNYRETNNAATLTRSREMILKVNPSFSGFYPLSCVIVTWSEATRIPTGMMIIFTV